MELTEKQECAFNSIKEGKNVFLTGPAGSGKSFLLKYFIDWYKIEKETNNGKIYITSTTGLSALLIDGMTINRYAGVGIGDKDCDFYYKKINKLKNIKSRWKNTGVLIIDEISMMDPDFFDKLEIISRKIRKNDKPFGGIQIILSGDFLQLPPVKSDSFCFESFSWDDIINETYYFDKIIRQNDLRLQNVLNNIRIGFVNNEVKELLNECLNKDLKLPPGMNATLLFSKKSMVIEYNNKKINKLIDEEKLDHHIYHTEYNFNEHKDLPEDNIKYFKELLDSQYPVDDIVMLSIHSQVMLTINMPELGLANGSLGIIIDFTKDDNHYPIVEFLNNTKIIIKKHEYIIEEESIVKYQIPLILAWAITIHKAQGMSLEYVQTDIGSSIFEYGQAYVVLSRIKNIDGLSLNNIDYNKIKAHPKVLKYYDKLKI